MNVELVVERPLDDVVVLRINRPEVHNALHSDLLAELADAVDAARSTARAIVITGTGEKSFSAGADLDELRGLGSAEALRVMSGGQASMRLIESSPLPVIAAVNGLALGGGFELVLSCSFAILAEGASLGLPEAGLGLIPGYGGTQRLTRLVGTARARFVMLSGRRIGAAEAHRWGLTPVAPVAQGDLLTTAVGLAEDISGRGPEACASILRLSGLAADQTLDGGLSLETRAAADAIASSEGREGVQAFIERRAPQFGPQT